MEVCLNSRALASVNFCACNRSEVDKSCMYDPSSHLFYPKQIMPAVLHELHASYTATVALFITASTYPASIATSA